MYFHHHNQELAELKEHVLKQARIRICTNAPAQYAAAVALQESDVYLKDVLSRLRERRDLVYKRLNEITGISTAKPEGAFYIFPRIDLKNRWPTDEAFVMALLKETGVLVVHGSGFDPVYGARPLKRAIQQGIENQLAQEILSGHFQPGDTVEIAVEDGGFTFKKNGSDKATAA